MVNNVHIAGRSRGLTSGALQGSSGFRNACVTDTGAIGGKLLAIATPQGLHVVEGQSSADLGNLTAAYQSNIADRCPSTVNAALLKFVQHKLETCLEHAPRLLLVASSMMYCGQLENACA